jgi:GntR family transcriptional regulator
MDKLRADEGGSRADERPLHRVIADALRRQIEAGELRAGDLLPSEHELVRRYRVSRGTVRQALAALRADGTVGGSQGKQLSVRGSHLTQPLSELISFSAWAQSLGKQPSSRVVDFELRPADTETRAMLDLATTCPVHHLTRVRLADGEPLMIERTVFAPRVGALLANVDLEHCSIYAELARRGVVFASARHTVGALAADRADAALLDVPLRTPLLRVRRRAFSLAGEPLEWSDDRYRADRVSFTIENAAMVSGVVRHLQTSGGN